MSNVNASDIMAEVSICEPVVTDCLNDLDTEKVNAYLCCHGNCVPLTELCPVYDETGQHDETTLAIEHVRYMFVMCVCGVCDLLLFHRSPYWSERFFKSNLTLLYVIKCKCND